MVDYVYFHIYLILFVASTTKMIIHLIRWNIEGLEVPCVLFFLCIIGLSTNYAGFLRAFAGLYGITFSG